MVCQKCGKETKAPTGVCPDCGELPRSAQSSESGEDTLLKTFGILFGVYGRFSLITLLAVLFLEWGDFTAGFGRLIACLPIACFCQAVVFLGMMVLVKRKWALIPLGLILAGMGAGAVILILLGNHALIAAANLIFVIGLLIGVFECMKAFQRKKEAE